jgi:YD repeat-containing protein
MEYHPVFKKLTKVTNSEGTTIFEYNDNAELVFAKVNDEKWIKLAYDNNNKIIQLEDNDNKMKFEYNTMGKPVKIELEGKGALDIEYDQNGEILSVNSTGGHQVSLLVTQTFQQLLSIVKPAGVNLDF